jgi:hypothetical protein
VTGVESVLVGWNVNGDGTGTITITNPNGFEVWLVDTSGSPTVEYTFSWYQSGPTTTVSVEDADSIRRYRTQPLPVPTSIWRQRSDTAYQIADRLLSDLAVPRATLKNIQIVGDPRLEIGDLVRVVDADGLGVDDRFRITGITSSGSATGGFVQSITARGAASVAVWDESSWDDTTVWGE